MLKSLAEKIKNFDYFNLGNSFALYYLFIFFSLPFMYFVGARITHLDSLRANASISAEVAAVLIVGLLFFMVGYRVKKPNGGLSSCLGLQKPWRGKNTLWAFAALLIASLGGKIIMFLNGHYLISTRIFHMEPLFGSINSSGLGQFTGYLAIPGLVLVAFAFTRYFELKKQGNVSYKLWGVASWALLVLEVVSGLLTGNRLPVITVIMTYAAVRHYGYEKNWKHFLAILAFGIVVIMPVGSFLESPESMLYALKTSRPSQVILDSTVGRFSQNVVVSSVIEKTEEHSYGKNLLNFFISLGPPRFIWKDKPIISFQGNEFGRRYGLISDSDFNTNVGPTMVGDLYMNFGILGIMGGLFVVGFIFRFIRDLFISHSAIVPGGVMIYALVWPDLIKGMENDIASVFAGAVKLILFAYLIHLCLTIDWKRFLERIAGFWRPLIVGVFILFFIGDTVRKLVPGQPWQLMLVLDAVLFLAYVVFVIDYTLKKESPWRPFFLFPLSVFLVVFLISIFGPRSAGWGAALVGFRSYFWFIPLMWLGYEFFDSKEKIFKLCRILSYVAIPLLVLAGIQQIFHSSDVAFLNPFTEGHKFHSGDVNIGLVSSFFGSAQRFGMVSMLLFFLGIAAKSPVALFAFAGIILSGSRSAFVLSVFGCVAILIFSRKRLVGRGLYLKMALGALMVIIALASVPQFRNTVLFQLKDGIPMIVGSRIRIFAGEMREVWGNHFSWLGKRAGAFSQGIEYIGEAQALSIEKPLGETGIRNLLLELGMAGLIAFYVMWASILSAMYKGTKAIRDPVSKTIGLAILVFAIGVLFRFTVMHGQTLNDYAVLVPLWFFIGVFFRLKSNEDASRGLSLPARA